MKSFAGCLAVIGLTTFTPNVIAQEAQSVPSRTITNIRGDLYRVQVDQHFTVFLVTTEGIILADPLNRVASDWLKAELDARFPDQRVRYVIFTHHAYDRVGGASVFEDTAEVIGHDRFTEERARADKVFPAALAQLDRNHDGVLDFTEIADDLRQSTPALRDPNRDGVVTPAELYSDVSFVESTYSAQRTITLGGKRVELIHPGDAYARDMTALYFPAERVVFAAGYPPLSSMPFSFGESRASAVLASMRTVATVDFDTFVSGDGTAGTRADFNALSQYVEDLIAGVNAGFSARRTVSQLQSNSDSRATPSLYGMAQINQLQRSRFCIELFTDCDITGGPSFTASAGVSVSFGRLAVLAETNTAGRFTGRRWSTDSSESTVEHRDRLLVHPTSRASLGSRRLPNGA